MLRNDGSERTKLLKEQSMNEATDFHFQSIFKVKRYYYCHYNKKRCHWPEFKLYSPDSIYFQTLAEAEEYVQRFSQYSCRDTYAFVVTELPLGFQLRDRISEDYFSERIYLPDGTLWGVNDYADIMQTWTPLSVDEAELGHYLGKKRMFHGRTPEEIRFKPGDIVEVFCYPGNSFWGDDYVSLAIVVQTPPPVDEVARMREDYMATHSDYDLSDHSLGYEFGSHLDCYIVIPYNFGDTDYSPTIATMRPSLPISTRRKNLLISQYEQYLAGELKPKEINQ